MLDAERTRQAQENHGRLVQDSGAYSTRHEGRDKNTRARFELKIVYRTLRLISDWMLSGFFSEVHIEGKEEVPETGALILTPCHHNEIIDIATLSATVPYRRIIAYWAKASLFKNPAARLILSSAGAIPVARTPKTEPPKPSGQADNLNGTSKQVVNNTRTRGPNGHQALFDATYKELGKSGGGVLGIFPEGTSYTLPRIVQVKEGAARAALGYIRWIRDQRDTNTPDHGDNNEAPISIIPVGIVYTDKSRYRSRIYVRYGKAIDLKPYIQLIPNDNSGGSEDGKFQQAVRNLTEEIKKELLHLTINAPNWEVLYAARTARMILWEDERSLSLNSFVAVSQKLINLMEGPVAAAFELKHSLLRYHALLYHTGMAHSSLAHIPYPPPNKASQETDSLVPQGPNKPILSKSSILKLSAGLPSFMIPLLLSSPTHVAHLPAYIFGSFASRIFAKGNEETRAQYKVIFGGLGRVLGVSGSSVAFVRSVAGRSFFRAVAHNVSRLISSWVGSFSSILSALLPEHTSTSSEMGHAWGKLTSLADFVGTFVKRAWLPLGGFRDWLGIIGVAWLLCIWHALVIDSNYLRYKRACTTLSVLHAMLPSRRSGKAPSDELKPYLLTPPPPINPYIAKSSQEFPESKPDGRDTGSYSDGSQNSLRGAALAGRRGRPPKTVLVQQLLLARADAAERLRSTFRMITDNRCDLSDDTGVASPNGGIRNRREHQGGTVVADLQFLRERGAVF